jgi:hypothetical protein
MTSSSSAQPSFPRELAVRDVDGLHVTLLWYPGTEAVAVRVDDYRLGVRFEVPVPASRAWHAFEHPFTYADADAVGEPVHDALTFDAAA